MRLTTVVSVLGFLAAAAPGAAAAREAAIGAVSTVDVRIPDARNRLAPFGTGVGLSLLYLSLGRDVPTGVEASTLFLVGDDGQRLYDLGISVVASLRLRDAAIAPFASFGLDLAAATVPRPGQPVGPGDRWVSLGVHANVGVHGFLSKCLYWRAQVGFLGAGVEGLLGQISLGYVFNH